VSVPACCQTTRWPQGENYFTLRGEAGAGFLTGINSLEIPVLCKSHKSASMHSDISRTVVLTEDVLSKDVFFLTFRLLLSYIYDISSLRVNDLTLILLTWRKW